MSAVLQLSDLHLGRMPEREDERLAILVETARMQAPDLIVISGDLCDDAPCIPEQIEFGKRSVDALTSIAPVRIIPGNHDIGNKPGIANDALTPKRYAQWQKVFGNGWFREDLAGYAVLGLNSQIMGSGYNEEAQQRQWLDDQLATCEHAIVFMHMPPDLPALVDVDSTQRKNLRYWPVDSEPRGPLLERLRSPKIQVLCSGHLHNHADLPHATPPRRWCPSLSFGVTIPGVTGTLSRGDRIGGLRHTLRSDAVTSAFVPVDLPVSRPMTL
ncbi:MAG: metallophosphoesterase [Planctomycetota bacterium]